MLKILFPLFLLFCFNAYAEKGVGKQDGFRDFDLVKDVIEPLAGDTYNWEELPIDKAVEVLQTDSDKVVDFIKHYKVVNNSPEGLIKIMGLEMAVQAKPLKKGQPAAKGAWDWAASKFSGWLDTKFKPSLGSGINLGSSTPQMKIHATIKGALKAQELSDQAILDIIRANFDGKEISNFYAYADQLPEYESKLDPAFNRIVDALGKGADIGPAENDGRMSAPRGTVEASNQGTSEVTP
ncbi:MAG: hypothetical protein PHW04_19030 [Candidatus Wallbacteria bacterium]|nr:hypothetical protein [Candidatus Wallbacteria bacterium]